MITIGVDEHLGFVLEPPERLGVKDPIPVPLERGAIRIRFLLVLPAPGLAGKRGGRRKQIALFLLTNLSSTPGHRSHDSRLEPRLERALPLPFPFRLAVLGHLPPRRPRRAGATKHQKKKTKKKKK